MENREVTPGRLLGIERSDLMPQRVVDRDGVNVRNMTEFTEKITDTSGMVTDRVTLMRGRNPLINDHVSRHPYPQQTVAKNLH